MEIATKYIIAIATILMPANAGDTKDHSPLYAVDSIGVAWESTNGRRHHSVRKPNKTAWSLTNHGLRGSVAQGYSNSVEQAPDEPRSNTSYFRTIVSRSQCTARN